MRKKIFTFLLALVTSVGLSWATDPILISTNTQQSSYTQGDITITCSKPGTDSDGFYLQESGNETATITNSGSSTISQIELEIGWFPQNRTYVRANGAESTSSDEYSITFSNVNSNNVTLTITDEKIQIRNVTITLADEGGSTPAVDPEPTPSATGGIFANCYDCWRAPEYPTISGQCRLYNFGNPYVGNNNPSGPWKLEFVGNYDSSSSEYDSNIVGNYAASQYGKTPEQMEVYRLYQWQNGAYQPVAYGVLYAYANESNPVEHAAFFEAGGHWGCYFTDNTHSGGDDFNITFNEDASTGFADLHGSTPTPTSSGDKLSGVFSISSTKTVNFSKGNLQYVGGAWQFAENQWDVIGASQTDDNRDLFGWGTGNNPNQTSMQYGDYTTFADWGSNMSGDWRTLTNDEWSYIFNTRTSASDLRGSATVCGVHGYIILPDNFVLPDGLSWTPRPDGWTTNVYTSQEWSSMEENGAVFLPAAGYRASTTVIYDESAGYYWSATEHSQAYNAYNVWVAEKDNDVKVFYRSRTFGQSVRLVSETAPAPAPTAAVIGDPNNASEVETFLTTYDGQTIDELIIDRPVLNNMYNTLCLPFDMNATQIAASSLNGVEIREFTGASVEGTTLNLSVGDPVNAVVAGRPYFVKFSAASQLDDLHFEDVTINNALLDNMAVTFDGVTFKGTFTPFVMPNGLNFQGGYLFLGQNNQLFWPNTSNPLKPFRAYFYVDVESSTPGNAPKYRGMPARIVEGKNVTTGVENAQSANQSTKVIVNGQLIIIKNDVRYNAQGQIVK